MLKQSAVKLYILERLNQISFWICVLFIGTTLLCSDFLTILLCVGFTLIPDKTLGRVAVFLGGWLRPKVEKLGEDV